MNQNDSDRRDVEVLDIALESVIDKFDDKGPIYKGYGKGKPGIKAFRDVVSNSSYFPNEELNSYEIPVIVTYLKHIQREIISNRLVKIEDLLYDMSFTKQGFDNECGEVYEALMAFKRLFSGQVGVSRIQLYPYALYVYDHLKRSFEIEEFQTRTNDFCLDKFVDEHGLDAQIMLVRMKYLLKQYVPLENKKGVYKVLLQETKDLRKKVQTLYLVEHDLLLSKLAQIKSKYSIGFKK